MAEDQVKLPRVDPFKTLDLEPKFAIDSNELERRFLEKSRQSHPDLHFLGDDQAQEKALAETASVNLAYAILKDPFQRAGALLDLLGGPSASELRQMPTDFLEEMLETRMEIEDLEDKKSPAAAEIVGKLHADRRAVFDEIANGFEAVLCANEPDQAALAEIRMNLNRIKYLDGLLKELDA